MTTIGIWAWIAAAPVEKASSKSVGSPWYEGGSEKVIPANAASRAVAVPL